MDNETIVLNDYEKTLAYRILKDFCKNNRCGLFASKFRKEQVEYENRTASRLAEQLIRDNVSLHFETED